MSSLVFQRQIKLLSFHLWAEAIELNLVLYLSLCFIIKVKKSLLFSFQLVGQTVVRNTGNARKRTITLGHHNRIKVQKGDAIGLFYPKHAGLYPAGIQYDECSVRLNGPYGSHYESVTESGKPTSYKKGKNYLFRAVREKKICRIYSLNAIIL
ncbi:hypothetical protein KUTeg_016136 [Tegillarca granosa]|uniref:Uncharacterized protein n=1 Tax=Tegillarca granosa TaxID=220873 RepID=A0ABQ9ENU9_TEGGR|nr:hypothetical protein KUTeg_016136 [Tegillarca granosa]